MPVTTNGTTIDHFDADVENTFDYTPFGAPMNERSFRLVMKKGPTYSTNPNDKFPAFVNGNEPLANIASENPKYRYGFNGKEKDDEVKGAGDNYNYGMRIYDPRIGKFLSVDPIAKKYPMLTPYQFASNNPIMGVDLDGKEFDYYMTIAKAGLYGETVQNVVTSSETFVNSIPDAFNNWWEEKKDQYNFTNELKNWSQGNTGTADYNNPSVPENLQKTLNTQQAVQGSAGLLKKSVACLEDGATAASIILAPEGALMSEGGAVGSIWTLGYKERGLVYEAARGGNLPKNFPTIDKVLNGTVTSIKTIDVNLPGYLNKPSQLKSTLKGYVNKLADFEGAKLQNVSVSGSDITQRVLQVGIPQKVSKAQQAIFNQIKAYGATKNVKVVFEKVK